MVKTLFRSGRSIFSKLKGGKLRLVGNLSRVGVKNLEKIKKMKKKK